MTKATHAGQQDAVPDATPLLDLIDGFRKSKVLFAALNLGIFDGCRPQGAATERILDTCVALGLLHKEGGGYANTPLADAFLRHASPSSLAGYIRYSDAALYRLWFHLEDAVIEGTPRWKQTFGEGASIQSFMQDDEHKLAFLKGMHGFGLLTSPAVVRAFDLSPFRCLVDLGGATGHLAGAAVGRYKQMRAILFELPHVLDLIGAEVPAGVETHAGDFMEDCLPDADLFVLGKVLHALDDTAAQRLIRRLYVALPSGGALLLAERLLTEGNKGGVAAHLQSLNMLIVNQGQERTLREYTRILHEAGFAKVDARITGTPLDAVFAEKQ